MPHLTFTKDQPLYVETAALLREAIQSGALPGNSRLDSVTGLAKKFHTSRKVVENALRLLKEEGLIVSFPRRGLYVCGTDKNKVLLVCSTNSRTPESAAGELINILSDSSDWHLEFIEAEFLRHLPEDTFKRECSSFGSVLFFGQGCQADAPEIARLKTLNIPVLFPFASPADSAVTGFHALYSDTEAGTKMLLDHLKAQGCSSVGILGWQNPYKGEAFRLPKEKYLELIENANLKIPQRLFGTIHRDSVPGDEALADFMTEWNRFDAVICYSHLSALHLYTWCKKHKVNIPGDLKVAACGMRLHSELLDPPLTAFHIDRKRHLDEVMKFLKGEFPPEKNINMAIPPTLAIHASTSNSI
ncbi:MAG: GntR family transcriptional regulator [Lentisphaerae bacterium]|nr:GntR family transcriptional regulator [Lentisphaerota bacterium]